jgi:leucyl aminopeptidase
MSLRYRCERCRNKRLELRTKVGLCQSCLLRVSIWMTFSSSNGIIESPLTCLQDDDAGALPLHAIQPSDVDAVLAELPLPQASFVRQSGFCAAAGEVMLLPGDNGLAGALLGLGRAPTLHIFGALPYRLPPDSLWRLHRSVLDPADAAMGFCLGAYAFTAFRAPTRRPARLVRPAGAQGVAEMAATCSMVRDLINFPSNMLGPAELAEVTAALAARHAAAATIVQGDALAAGFPAVAAVGRGSARAPRVAQFTWAGSGAAPDAPLIALCGKGVCFDSGGYDLKPAAGMLRMKKDMGGAAIVLGVARLIMQADLPVRLFVQIGCVENSVSGDSMRPLDVLQTRRGLSVEVGNTDAEGRLVLCDLLAAACEQQPAVLIDCATLTGAARVALGPDLPVLFCNDDALADAFHRTGQACADPIWRLPLWSGYDPWLNSEVADTNNVASKPLAGAIVAGLFLQRFVTPGTAWAHFDVYAWNDATQPGRPEGGEAQAMRCIFATLRGKFHA